jgi:hypothetical protein
VGGGRGEERASRAVSFGVDGLEFGVLALCASAPSLFVQSVRGRELGLPGRGSSQAYIHIYNTPYRTIRTLCRSHCSSL